MITGNDLHELVKKSGFTIGRISAVAKRSPAALHKDFKEATIKKELYDKIKKAIDSMPENLKGRKKKSTKKKTAKIAPSKSPKPVANTKGSKASKATVGTSEPKKRGRKPGSKNKPKVDAFVAPDGKNYRELYFEQLELNNKLIRRLMNL